MSPGTTGTGSINVGGTLSERELPELSEVPEPASMLMMGSGLVPWPAGYEADGASLHALDTSSDTFQSVRN
jgi:hypothetical protein